MGTEIKAKKKVPVWAIIIGVLVIVAAVVGVVFFMSEGSRSDDVSAKLERAERYMSDLKYEQAIALYNEVLEIEPKNVKAYKGLFDAYMATDNEKKAKRVLSKLEEVIEESKGNTKEKLSSAAEKMRKELGMGAKEEQSYASNPEGETREVANYRNSGTVENVEIYDGTGKIQKKTFYSADGSEKYYDLYEYDEQGRAVKVTSYTPEGSVYDYKVNTYGDNDYCVMSQFYDAYGNMKHVEVYEYYGDGTILKVTDCYADGSICMIKEYDTLGRLVKVSPDNSETGDINQEYHYWTYSYDEFGRRTRCEKYYRYYHFTGTNYDFWGAMEWKYGTTEKPVSGNSYEVYCSSYDYTYEYAEDGSCVEYGTITEMGEGTSIGRFDADGKLIEQRYINTDGTPSYWYSVRYGLKGEPISRINYNKNGSVESEEYYTREDSIFLGCSLHWDPMAVY